MRHCFDRLLFTMILVGLSQMSARGDSIATLSSTGQGLPTGVTDPNFTIIASPSGATLKAGGATDTIAPVTSPAYAKAPAGTQWIGPNVNNMLDQPTGNYDFRTTFSLAGLDPSTAKITGVLSTDNKLVDVYLNGTNLGISGGSLGTLLNFSISSGFQQGKNTLDFVVNNDSTGGPTALMVSETGTASPTAAPEPSSLAVFGLAALVLLGRRLMEWRAERC